MKMILGCLMVLTGTMLFAGQMLPERQTALIGALAQATDQAASESRPLVAQAPSSMAAVMQRADAAQVAPNGPLSLAVVRASLESSAPESAQPDAQQPNAQVPQDGSPGVSIEVMRENERQQTLVEQMKPLLAQRAVFMAERDATAVAVPKQLADLAGEQEAQRLVAAQASARAAARAETEAQDVTLAASIDSIKRELAALHERQAQIDANTATKSDRLKLLQTAKKGVIAGATLGEARTAVAEIEERRQDVLIAIAQTEQRLTQAEQERAKLAHHARAELEQGLLALEGQISQLATSLTTSQGVLAVMQGLATVPPVAGAAAPQAPAEDAHL